MYKKALYVSADDIYFSENKLVDLAGDHYKNAGDYFSYMEKAGLIGQLRTEIKGIRGLGKVEKVYLDNTNMLFNMGGNKSNVGNIRETLFLNQMRLNNDVTSTDLADFSIDGYTFEIGGKNTKQNRRQKEVSLFLVKDDIEFGYRNVIPLWAFGLNY